MSRLERHEQIKFPFLDYERDLALRAFILTPNRHLRGRRQRALFAFPFFRNLLVSSADLIDDGKPLLRALTQMLNVEPWVVRALRTANCNLIHNENSLRALATFLAWFPPEQAPAEDEWSAFADAANVIEDISALMGIPQRELLRRCDYQWRRLSSSVGRDVRVGNVKAVLADFTRHVFLPEIYLQAENMKTALPSDVLELKFESLPVDTRRYLADALFGQKGPAALLNLCKNWRFRPEFPLSIPGGENARRHLNDCPSWDPLFAPKQIDSNHMIVPLTSADEMIEEGLALSHCLGRYALLPAFDWYFPLSIRTVGGYRLSSAMLRLDRESEIQVWQHRGYRNHDPDPRVAILLTKLVLELNQDLDLKKRWKLSCAARCRTFGKDVRETWSTYQFYFKPARDWAFSAYFSPLLPAVEAPLTRDQWLTEKKIVDLARTYAGHPAGMGRRAA